jgi:2-(1,2-epoxy-1,2-dihydrophenyl)acetyl-CoA isomerase
MPFETILFEIAGGVATLTLNRPDKLNAFTTAMHEELREAMSRVRADATLRALLITGSGRGFCAGQDLSERVMKDAPAPSISGQRSKRTITRWCVAYVSCRSP